MTMLPMCLGQGPGQALVTIQSASARHFLLTSATSNLTVIGVTLKGTGPSSEGGGVEVTTANAVAYFHRVAFVSNYKVNDGAGVYAKNAVSVVFGRYVCTTSINMRCWLRWYRLEAWL